MTHRADDLPEFTNPPVVEVILSAQFGHVEGFGVIHYGLLWEHFSQEFPGVREMPPLEPAFELFGARSQAASSMKVEIIDRIMPRLWFFNQDETRLIQIQPDRLVHNWRKIENDNVYPRYEQIKAGFIDAVEKLNTFLSEKGMSEISVNQCEISYLNHITVDDVRDSALSKMFRLFSDNSAENWSGEIEDFHFSMKHILRGNKEKPYGRLHVQVDPFDQADGKKSFLLNLTARGRPETPDIDGMTDFFDKGRDTIVRRFTEITSDHMHKVWGRMK